MAKGKKTGGRKKGSLNKKTKYALDILEDYGFCPIAKGVETYERALLEFEEDRSDFRFKYLEIAQRELQDLRQYVFPKRKAVELTGAEGQPISFIQLIQQYADDDAGGSDSTS